jgi:tetratricopeptide (TPR) repeat protein
MASAHDETAMSDAGLPLGEVGPAAPPSVQPEHSSAFLRLGQLWQRNSQFSLLLAAVDDSSYRDHLIARLQALGPAQRIDLAPTDSPQDWLNRLLQAHADGASRVHVCLPVSPRRPDVWWQQANVLRERLADAFPAAQLLWMSDADVDAAAHQAPDLWNWREAVFSFSASLPAAGLSAVPGEAFRASGGQDAAIVANRLAHIERALAGQSDDDSGGVHLWLEAAYAHQRLGHWPAAEAAAQRAASGFQQVGNAASEAEARALSATLQWQRGDLEGALLALRTDVLPIFERLGDLRSKAVTMGHIADILQVRRLFDEALRIRQHEQLPVFERLGDVRAKAMTMGKIADILQVRRQLDEALRIRQHDQLPVFESLGDVRSKAVTMGEIADILQARGQLDEALRIRRHEQLPVFERLGDVRERAVTLFKIANQLAANGRVSEALRTLIEEVLPAFESLGMAREADITRHRIDSLRP